MNASSTLPFSNARICFILHGRVKNTEGTPSLHGNQGIPTHHYVLKRMLLAEQEEAQAPQLGQHPEPEVIMPAVCVGLEKVGGKRLKKNLASVLQPIDRVLPSLRLQERIKTLTLSKIFILQTLKCLSQTTTVTEHTSVLCTGVNQTFPIRNSRMGVTAVAPSHGYPQLALPAGPSQETHLLASSVVVGKDPEWKTGWWAHDLLFPYSVPERSAWLFQPACVCV